MQGLSSSAGVLTLVLPDLIESLRPPFGTQANSCTIAAQTQRIRMSRAGPVPPTKIDTAWAQEYAAGRSTRDAGGEGCYDAAGHPRGC